MRGDVIIPRALMEYARGLGVVKAQETQRDIALAAGWTNAKGCKGWRRIVLAEHGVGQAYLNEHPAYAGGIGRDGAVDLFLCPNSRVAILNHAYGKCAIVGDPYLDELRKLQRLKFNPVASFHWNCFVCPETQSARRVYWDVLSPDIARHAHPRETEEVEDLCNRENLHFIRRFEDVVQTASVFLADNTSALFYAAALNIPVVVLNAPWYRRNVHHGIRFWEHASIGPQVWQAHPELIEEAMLHARDVREWSGAVWAMKQDLFPVTPGKAARLSAEAILQLK